MTRAKTVPACIAAALMLISAAAAWFLRPTPAAPLATRLAEVVPRSFQDWTEIKTELAPVDPTATDRDGGRNTDSPYDDVLMRAYVNPRGDVVFLALAYGHGQRQEVKIHRPDLCYVAQGFRVLSRSRIAFPADRDAQPAIGERMLVQSLARVEAVSYWIRIGRIYSNSAWATRYYIFNQGLHRSAPDGILVRVSQIVASPAAASAQRFLLQEQFITDLVRAMPPEARRLLTVG